MSRFPFTSDWLLARREEYQKQIDRINKAFEFLNDGDLEFEVQFQAHWPDQQAVAVRGKELHKAYFEAVRQWRDKNTKSTHPGLSSANAYVCIDELLVLLKVEDALKVAEIEGVQMAPGSFTVDSRLVEKVTTTVWQRGETPIIVVAH